MSSPTRITLWTRRRWGEAVYLNLINKAERYVYAMTPYLIISDSVNTALCNAAKSGGGRAHHHPAYPGQGIGF